MSWWDIVKNQVKITDKLYPEEEMLKIWNDYWKNNDKSQIRIARRDKTHFYTKLSTINPKFFMAFYGEIPIGYCGIENNGSFFASAGVYVVPKYRREGGITSGVSSKLMEKRLNVVKGTGKALTVFFNNANLPKGAWFAAFKRKGYKKVDLENLPIGVPKKTMEEEVEAYGKDKVLIYSD
tara:strand:+ start:317 stop:856 length:540 start_codon:yes stop_codon:yes gene_type:complete